MKKIYLTISIILLTSICAGCAQITEGARTLWGSSTRVLERERVNALRAVFECPYDACFDKILDLERDLAKAEEDVQVDVTDKAVKGKTLDEVTLPRQTLKIFMKSRIKKYIVVMGVPNAVDTTEVGIFFIPQDANTTQIDISSLSSHAKKKAAEIIFQELAKYYREIK